MEAGEITVQFTEGTILEGPHWTEPVKVLTAKVRGSRIEVQAVGMLTKRLWTKLLKLRSDMQDKSLGSRYIDMSKLTADVQQSRENRPMPEYIEKLIAR